MYERMLDPDANPDYDALAAFCADGETFFRTLNTWLSDTTGSAQTIRFPYGKKYGWGVKHAVGSKHLCDLFAENGACCLMLRMSGPQFARVYADVSEPVRKAIDGKYPCGDGGYIHLRIADEATLTDAKKLLTVKTGK